MNQEILSLLQGTKLKELRKIQNLVLLKDTCSVEDALQVLAQYKILSAPVVVASENEFQQNLLNGAAASGQNKQQKVDNNKNFANIQFPQDCCTNDVVGFVDIKDIIGSFLADLDSKDIVGMKIFSRINHLEDWGLEFCGKNLKDLKIIGTDGTFIHDALSSVSLMDLIYQGFLQPKKLQRYTEGGFIKFPPVVHRAAIFDNDGRILNILSQTDIVKFILEQKSKLGDLGQKLLIDLEIGTSPVVVAYPSMMTFEVLKIMSQKFIHAVAVVNKQGQIIGNFSYSVMRNFASEHFGTLGLPVGEFLALERGSEYAGYAIPHSEGEQGQENQNPQEPMQFSTSLSGRTDSKIQANVSRLQDLNVKSQNSINLCSTGDTFLQVLEKLVVNRIHRVYLTDENMCPIKVVTLTDVMKLLVGFTD